jgi:hypothetical protein
MKVEFMIQQRIDVSPGWVVDLPDDYAKHLIAGGCAFAEGNTPKPKTATPPQPEPAVADASDD